MAKKKTTLLNPSNFTHPNTALKHIQVLNNVVENGGNMAQAIRDTKLYSEVVANDPGKITNSKTWNEIMEVYITDNELAEKHKQLLNSYRMDHMTFPLGPKDEDDINFSGSKVTKSEEESSIPETLKERTTMTDKEIIDMLAEVGCRVRRIVHGESARHVYFWSPDNMAQDKALDKAYKLKKRYGDPERPPGENSNTYNFIFSDQIQSRVNSINAEIKNFLTQPKDVQEN